MTTSDWCRSATPSDIPALRMLATHGGTTLAALFEQHLGQPRYRPALTRVLHTNGDVVGFGLISHQRMIMDGASLDCGRLDALWLLGDQRHLPAMLGDWLGTLASEGLPFALVDAPPAQFAGPGYVPWGWRSQVALPPLADESALRPATPADQDDVAALYRATYGTLPLAADRTLADWRAEPLDRTLVLENQFRQLAGVVRTNGTNLIVEAAATPVASHDLLAAVQRLADSPLLALSPAHPLFGAALARGGKATLSAHQPDQLAPLAGVVDLQGALRALLPAFAARLARSRYADWRGSVGIETASSRALLVIDGGQIQEGSPTQAATVRLQRASIAGLAYCLLATRSIADLRASGLVVCDDAEQGLLDVLFPARLPCSEPASSHGVYTNVVVDLPE